MAADATIKGIEFQVIGEAKSAQSSLDALSNTLKRLKRVLGGGLGMNSLVRNLEKLSAVSNNVNTENIEKFAKALKSFGKIKLDPSVPESIKEVSRAFKQFDLGKMESLGNAMNSFAKLKGFGSDNFKSGMAALVYGLQQIQGMDISNLEKAGDAARNLADAFRQGQKKDGSGKAESGVVPKVDPGTAEQYRNAFDIIFLAAKQKLAPVIDMLRQLGKSMGGAALRGFGQMLTAPFARGARQVAGYAKSLTGVLGGFKRIVGYRMIRSIIREITQGFSEGIKNLYGWSNMVGGKFASSMDQITTSMTYLKNSLAAAAAPIVNALAPAIDFLIDKIVALLNLINQLFAKLSGATSWTRAKKKADEYGDAVGGAGAAAKEALKYLAPFDELNRLPDDRSGGGGGGGGEDFSDMFEDVTEFSEGIANFADMIREKIQAGDWQGLGQTLGNKVNEIIDNIDFAGAGAKVGGFINAWFTTRYWTFETINFTNIGTKIGQFLNNAISPDVVDFETIGRTLTQPFTNLGDLIIGAVQEINWTSVGSAVGNLVRGAFNQMSDWLSGIDWEDLGRNIPVYIGNAIEGLDVGALANSIWRMLKGAVEAAIGLLSGLGQWLFGGGALEIKMSLTNAIGSIGSWIKQEIIDPIVGKFNEFVANHPTIAKLLGFPGAAGGGGLSIDASEFSGITGTLSIDAEANVTSVKDDVPTEQKSFSGFKGIFQDVKDSISTAKKTIGDCIANFTGKQNSLTSGQRTFSSTANFTDKQNSLTSGQRTFTTTANFADRQNNLTGSQRTFPSTANFNNRANNLTGEQRTFNSTANFNNRANNLTGSQRTFSSTANFGSIINNLTGSQRTFSSTANFVSRNSSELNTTFGSTANFVSWLTSWWNDPDVDATAALKEPYWKYGTPTMTVHAEVDGFSGVSGKFESGGVINHGNVFRIPQYASGGSAVRHGSLMIAGEAGAEVVGHIGGRTEVLNRSQLASTMYAAVRSAMSGVAFNVSFPSMSASATDDGANEDMLYRAFLRALNDSDVSDRPIELDGAKVYQSVVNRNRTERRRTGINPMLSY